jgi:histidinol dehydrogenase
MPIRLDSRAPDFPERFRAFLATKREAAADVEATVRAIIADVAARGDRALVELTRELDRVDLDASGLKISAGEIELAYAACDRKALDALALARARIEAYHVHQKPADERFTDALGVERPSQAACPRAPQRSKCGR